MWHPTKISQTTLCGFDGPVVFFNEGSRAVNTTREETDAAMQQKIVHVVQPQGTGDNMVASTAPRPTIRYPPCAGARRGR